MKISRRRCGTPSFTAYGAHHDGVGLCEPAVVPTQPASARCHEDHRHRGGCTGYRIKLSAELRNFYESGKDCFGGVMRQMWYSLRWHY